MKTINLTKGYVALVDDDDFERLMERKWQTTIKKNGKLYASASYGGKNKRMHRVILDPPPEFQVDHIDGNGLNNQKSNLRLCTNAENSMNRKKRTDTLSKYKGVFRLKGRDTYRVEIYKDGKKHIIGHFKDEDEGALAYNEAAKKMFGDFARPNVIF